MKNKDELKILFKDSCPEPCDNAEFTESVLRRIGLEKPCRNNAVSRRRLIDFLTSPIPIIVCVTVIFVCFRDVLEDFLLKLTGMMKLPIDLSYDSILVILCSLASLAIVGLVLSSLSSGQKPIDIEQIRIQHKL